MRSLRVLVLMIEDFVPPPDADGMKHEDIAPCKTEYDVMTALQHLGHDAKALGVSDELGEIRDGLQEFKPHIVFNLLEEFRGFGAYVPFVLGYLELIGKKYTGCNPYGMMLAANKVMAKKILRHHRIPAPEFVVYPRGRRVRRSPRLKYPMIVKSATEHGSVGISQASVVHDDEKLIDRVAFMHEQMESDALVEEFIDGRELYVGVMGNRRLQTFPVWEIDFGGLSAGAPRIATERVKWNLKYQERAKIKTSKAKNLPDGVEEYAARLAKRTYRVLNQTGYGRMDFRLSEEGKIYLLESNPNPDMAYDEDFAESANAVGIPYEDLIQKILRQGLNYKTGRPANTTA